MCSFRDLRVRLRRPLRVPYGAALPCRPRRRVLWFLDGGTATPQLLSVSVSLTDTNLGMGLWL